MASKDTRGSVIAGVRRRDPERWREFDSIYRPVLLAFVRAQGVDASDAGDVVQEIFVKLLGKFETYDREKCRFRSWLFSVAHNTLIDMARRRATQKKAVAGWVDRVLHATPSDSMKASDEWTKLHRAKILKHALRSIRARTSSTVWACFEQRLLQARPGAEIARDLNIAPATVFTSASRVLKQVRAVCREFDEDLGDTFDARLSQAESAPARSADQ